MTTKYETRFRCPKCGEQMIKSYRPNHWTNIYTPRLYCSNPECSFQIYPNSREEQKIFDKMMTLLIRED